MRWGRGGDIHVIFIMSACASFKLIKRMDTRLGPAYHYEQKKKKMVCWHSQLCSIGELSDLCFLFSAFMACFVFCFLQRIYGLPGMPIFTTATNTAVQHHSTTPSFMEEVSAPNCAALLLGLGLKSLETVISCCLSPEQLQPIRMSQVIFGMKKDLINGLCV